MCVCVPAAWPFLAALAELAVPLLFVLGSVLVGAVAVVVLAVRGIATVISWSVVAWLERRSDRRWNARMAEIYPHLRGELPGRRRVSVSVVEPEQLALEPARPQALPPSVRVFATPRKELQR